jgi:hypothetical protein
MRSINPGFFEFLHFFLFLEKGHTLTLKPLRYFLAEAFNACVKQEYIIIALLEKLGCVVNSWLLIEVVENYDFALFVLVSIELRNELISLYANSWKIQGLSDVVVLVVFRVTQIDKQKVSIHSNW